jgi:hypothetical protein
MLKCPICGEDAALTWTRRLDWQFGAGNHPVWVVVRYDCPTGCLYAQAPAEIRRLGAH